MKNNLVACLQGWDTEESIDGYSLKELKDLREQLDFAILEMKWKDSNQLSLFGE